MRDKACGCVVECRICNPEVAGSNLSLGYFAPRSAQPSIPPGLVNEYQLRLGRQRQVWLIPIADERVGEQVKLWNPLKTRAIPERFCGGDSLRRGAISSVCTLPYLTLKPGSPTANVPPCEGLAADLACWICSGIDQMSMLDRDDSVQNEFEPTNCILPTMDLFRISRLTYSSCCRLQRRS